MHPELSVEERAEIMKRPRPRSLPIAPRAAQAARGLPLASEARAIDRACRPIYVVWELTLKCDLSCRHCGSRAGHERPDELSTAECLDLVRQMRELGVLEVTMIGGEAYLRDDWTEIGKAMVDSGMAVSMTTGGRGITPERARAAKAAGLTSVSVSIDGMREVHDRLRGVDGSFDRALAAMDALRAAGLIVTCNTQINRLSLAELPELLETIAAHGARSWQIQMTVPMGRAADEPDVLLQPYDFPEVFELLGKLQARAQELGILVWPGNNVGYFGPQEDALRGKSVLGHHGSCGAGQSIIGIEANGSIKGCPSLPTREWTGGNVRDASLKDIWERAQPLRYTRDRTVEDLWGYCRTCYYADSCRAGCTWTSSVFFGKPGNNPYCHHRALEMKRAGVRERLVRKEAPEGAPFDHGRFEIIVEALNQQEGV